MDFYYKYSRYEVATKDYLRIGKDGYDMLPAAECILDGEQAGIIPSLVRQALSDLQCLSGEEAHHLRRVDFYYKYSLTSGPKLRFIIDSNPQNPRTP